MAGLGIALRGLGKALKNISKNKKIQEGTGLFSLGIGTGMSLGYEGRRPRKKSNKTPTGMRMSKKKSK